MNLATRRALEDLNRRFYEAVGSEFDRTRDHPWPGWKRVAALAADRRNASTPAQAAYHVLDVGCGNGRFVFLLESLSGWRSRFDYLGIDASETLLAAARRRNPAPERVRFEHRDVIAEPLDGTLPRGPFALVACFGLLHHVPGFAQRRALLARMLERVEPGGLLAVTLWRFADFERFRSRIVPWDESADPIDRAELEPGDHLLRWSDGDAPPRYCHFVDDSEEERLQAGLPATLVDRFDADGRESRLNRYLVLTPSGKRPQP